MELLANFIDPGGTLPAFRSHVQLTTLLGPEARPDTTGDASLWRYRFEPRDVAAVGSGGGMDTGK